MVEKQFFTNTLKYKSYYMYNYQLSKAQRKFGYKVLASKLWCCHGQLTSFPLVTISTTVGCLSRHLQFHAV